MRHNFPVVVATGSVDPKAEQSNSNSNPTAALVEVCAEGFAEDPIDNCRADAEQSQPSEPIPTRLEDFEM